MEKGFGFIVVLIIWGSLLYFLFSGPLAPKFTGTKLFSSVISSFSNDANVQKEKEAGQKEIIGIFGDNNKADFQKANVHFNKSIDVFDVEISYGNPQLIFAGSNYGLFVSRDAGLNWYGFSDLESTVNSNTIVYKILFEPKTNQAYISVFQNNKGTVYESKDNFFSLEKIFEIQDEAVYDFDVIGDNLYLGLSNGRLLLYSLKKDESRVLTTLNSAIIDLKVSRNVEGLVYLTLKSGGFWVSKNNGQSFERMKFLDNYKGANKINGFSPSFSDNSLIYAATDYGLIKSSDTGKSWQVFKSLPAEETAISAVAFLDNPGEIFAASNDKIYKSRDYGLNWQTIETGFNDREISIIKPIGDKIIAATKKPEFKLTLGL